MAIASGVAKQVVMKKETAWGAAAPVRSGARYLRRVSSTLDLAKEAYESEEMRPDYQDADYRHGVRSVVGAIDGELAPGSYPEFMAAMLRKDFAAVTAMTAVSLTVGALASGTYPLTRAAGSWVTDGVKAGMVIRLTVGALHANNISKNLLVVDVTSATVLQVVAVNNSVLQAEGPITGCTVTVPGKVAYVPTTGHTDDSFAVEHYYSDIAQSELFLGNKIRSVKCSLPPTGIAKIAFDFMGKDLADVTVGRGAVAANTAYFTTPTAVASTGVVAAVNGAIYFGGVKVALLTGMDYELDGGMSAEPVVGSNVYPDITEGKVKVKGNITVLFQDATFRDYFDNETEVAVVSVFANGSGALAEFVSQVWPRIKVGGANKGDGEKGISQTMPFKALVAVASNAAYATTMMVQDSLAP